VELSGEASVPSDRGFAFTTAVETAQGGSRFRPSCPGWSNAQPADGELWQWSCVRRPGEPANTQWTLSVPFQGPAPPTKAYAYFFESRNLGGAETPLDCR